MFCSEMPRHWLSTSDGQRLLHDSGVQVALLIRCSSCEGEGVLVGRPCKRCGQNLVPGFHLMRFPLAELVEAIVTQALPVEHG